MNYSDNTIVALSTPNGVGAIGVIRLSGNDAVKIVNAIFIGKNLLEQRSHTIHLGKISYNKEILDEVLVSLFLAPSSYTKENVVEISCHGSPYIQQKIIEALIDNGASSAKAGEFTQRAFLNGRFDLSQAEAVADIIASDSQAAHKIAMNQMRGGISSKLSELRTALVDFTALIELELDFGEEDVEFADRTKLNELLHQIQHEIAVLLQSFSYGNAIKNGIPVAIVGKPNAGKSTLLNALLQEERAIVSAIAGTTRDTIEETLTIDGLLFRFIDTAGLREANDEIEKIGIERSKEAIEKADIVIYLFDIFTEDFTVVEEELKIIPKDKKIIILGNKQDLNKSNFEVSTPIFEENFIAISAKEKVGIDELKTALVNLVLKDKIDQNVVIISNQRHYEALQKSQLAIENVLQKLQQNISSDFISHDIKTALRHLGEITGNIDIDKDILATIFGKFCIGK
jgi:tRNA modification GTPase